MGTRADCDARAAVRCVWGLCGSGDGVVESNAFTVLNKRLLCLRGPLGLVSRFLISIIYIGRSSPTETDATEWE